MKSFFCILVLCLTMGTVSAQNIDEIRAQIRKGYKRSHVRYPHSDAPESSSDPNNDEHFYLTRTKPVNILMILADDLGFGDTSVPPFTGSGIKTPHLQKMADRGVVLTNFHAAATTCSPSRAAILTGMYPWRVGMKSVFEYGTKQSNRDDWLIQIPTAANLFSNHNYTTFHSGKWHLGGMRNDDYDMRRLQEKGVGSTGSKRCHHPGPNQQGFQHYVSVLDGPGAPRQNYLQVNDRLYSEGCKYLLYNDLPITEDMFKINGYLSYCEAKHAMRGMKESLDQGKPFYIHLWFHAPHGPWEQIPGYPDVFTNNQHPKGRQDAVLCDVPEANNQRSRFCALRNGRIVDRGASRFARYSTMVQDMDAQIGMVLDYIQELGIAEDTLVFFTSDNGWEDDAGGSGGLRGNKRHIYEGGIRVPAIAQWVGTFPAGGVMNSPAIHTDLFPTFADAAGFNIPQDIYKLDGTSILPELIHAINPNAALAGDDKSKSVALPGAPSTTAPYGILQIADLNSKLAHIHTTLKQKKELRRRHSMLQERLLLYHNDYEGPKRTVGITYDFKFILNENEIPMEIYDLRYDIIESNNLLLSNQQSSSINFWRDFIGQVMNQSKSSFIIHIPPNHLNHHHQIIQQLGVEEQQTKTAGNKRSKGSTTVSAAATQYAISNGNDLPFKMNKHFLSMIKSNVNIRKDEIIIFQLLYRLYPLLSNYALHGSNGYTTYLKNHPETRYAASPLSDQRPAASNVLRMYTPQKAEQLRKATVEQGSCPLNQKTRENTCNCAISTLQTVKAVPFYSDEHIGKNIYHISMNPTPFINATFFIAA